MKENAIKGALALLLAGTAACFRQLLAPLAVLAAVMCGDYVTGMMSAWATKTLSSKTGLLGLVKKLGYIFAVGAALAVDFVVRSAGATLGWETESVFCFGLLVTVWLILNECISILENLGELGVPVPGFLKAVTERLKGRAEERLPLRTQGELSAEQTEGIRDGGPDNPSVSADGADSSLYTREPSGEA